MYTNARLATTYSIFAVIATSVNISAQDLVIRYYRGLYCIYISVLIGTAAGLIVKYMLDKHYIFKFQTRDALHNSQTFIMYAVMGVATTFVFWGFEAGFNYFFETKEMRYFGGVIGLIIGYILKYRLDKYYVFCADT
jgi:putative flippase GtrA